MGRFWRYNYKALAGTGYWILAVPVAVSQIVTLWMMALSSDFSQAAANRIAELMTPVLGAFLVAHSLAPEYRSGVGAILACKPLPLNRVLAMRAGLGMLAALLLSLVTLGVCSIGLKPEDFWTPLLACLPSLGFLSALALVSATLFRSPVGGFAVALGLWGLDLALGYGAHPLLSLQGFSAAADQDALAVFWPAGKGLQLAAGAALWAVHPRLISRICRPAEKTDVLKIAAACLLIVAVYCVSGAATVVGYAYFQRGNLPQTDLIWLRRQLRAYGPVPVARLFGPAFSAYVSEPPVPRGGSPGPVRLQQLENALARWPRSLWADGIAFALAGEQQALDLQAGVARYLAVTDRYPASPFAPRALVEIVQHGEEELPAEQRLQAARRLVADYPHRREAERGADVLVQYYPARVRADELLPAIRMAARVAPPERRPDWLLRGAELEAELGHTAEALEFAGKARDEAKRLEAAARTGAEVEGRELGRHLGHLTSTAGRAETLITRLMERSAGP